VVQIWPGRFVCKQVTVCPGHIWTTLYIRGWLNKTKKEAGIHSSIARYLVSDVSRNFIFTGRPWKTDISYTPLRKPTSSQDRHKWRQARVHIALYFGDSRKIGPLLITEVITALSKNLCTMCLITFCEILPSSATSCSSSICTRRTSTFRRNVR
jgi:hypothetical protein